jgi:hypothetical protein
MASSYISEWFSILITALILTQVLTLFRILGFFVFLNDLSIFIFLFKSFTSYVLGLITPYDGLDYTTYQSYLSVIYPSVSFLILCLVLQVNFSFLYLSLSEFVQLYFYLTCRFCALFIA